MGDPSIAEMNISHLDGHNLNMNDLNTAANAIPFLSERRLVTLANPHSAYKGAKELKKLSAFIETLPPTTTLVLAEYLDSPANKNKSFYEWLQKLAKAQGGKVTVQTQEFNMPGRRDLPGWIIRETKKQAEAYKKHIKIDPAAAARLAEMVGENTRIAVQEIGKLLEYVDFERNVTVEDVEKVSIVSAQQDVFTLVDALGNKNGRKAQNVLQQLVQNEDPFSLWGMVIRQFRLLVQAREVMDGGGGQDDIARELHAHPFVVGKLMNQASGFDLKSLEEIYHRLLELDEGIKTGQATIELALDMLVVELCG